MLAMSSCTWLFWLACFCWCFMGVTGSRIRIVIDSSSSEGDSPPKPRVPRCTDHIKNQDETDIDCGGTNCPKCNNAMACMTDCDCVSDACKNKRCVPIASCDDNIKDQDETDIDCGGIKCPKCGDTKNCNQSSDCINGFCRNNTCGSIDQCMDNVKNGDETDIDCGGIKCPKCNDTETCNSDSDCISGLCTEHMCDPLDLCEDNIKDQDETDIDCGGTQCFPCADMMSCNQSSDCISAFCNDSYICDMPPSTMCVYNRSAPMLYNNQFIYSPTFQFYAAGMLNNQFGVYNAYGYGNVTSTAIWTANQSSTTGSGFVAAQCDKNIVVYLNNNPVWASNSFNTGSCQTFCLEILDNGNLIWVDSTNTIIWQSNSTVVPV